MKLAKEGDEMAIAHDNTMQAQNEHDLRIRQKTIKECAKVAVEASMCSEKWLVEWGEGMDVRLEFMGADEKIAFSHADWIAEQILALAMEE